jgi:tRNA U34 5-methylaminomethyl-2-thiouridine-forming methyltransferase MnmC
VVERASAGPNAESDAESSAAQRIPDPAPPWIPLRTEDGSWTLAHPLHGETCHSRAGAWSQALERYARPCRLRERALAGAAELHLLDIGTGLGLNLAAALAELEGTGCRLHAETFELQPSVLEAMLALVAREGALDPRAEPWHARVRAALARALRGTAAVIDLGGCGTLRVCLGDARVCLDERTPEPRFDAVFLDGFSPRREADLWQPEFLQSVARRMTGGAWLSTYTVSKPVRRALAAAGLQVFPGPAVGRKREGTLAWRAAAGDI